MRLGVYVVDVALLVGAQLLKSARCCLDCGIWALVLLLAKLAELGAVL